MMWLEERIGCAAPGQGPARGHLREAARARPYCHPLNDMCITFGFRIVRARCVLAQATSPTSKTSGNPDGAAVAHSRLAAGSKSPGAGGRPDGHRRRHDVAGRALAV